MPTLQLDGRAVAYVDADGNAQAAACVPPLLLVHGFTGCKEDFEAVVPALAAERRVVAVDLPGHGGSDGPADPAAYALETLAGWVLRVADALGLGELHLLGHSMGGLVVQRVAAAASQRLRGLVLMGTGLGALREDAAEIVGRVAVAARDRGLQAAYEESRRAPAEVLADRRAAAEPAEDEALARWEAVVATRAAGDEQTRARYLRMEAAAIVGGARSLVEATPLGPFLRGIDVPVLVVHGEHDYAWTPGEQVALARAIAGAELAVVPHSFHSPQQEAPEAWLAAVTAFLRRADAT